jgi:CPA2 family monovalent cation:H+ antiporter-2
MVGTATPWLQSHASWNLQVIDCVLPDLADCQGQRIAELELRSRFGCTVVGVERQGFMIPLPGPEVVLYPRDRVMLMGTGGQVSEGKRFLTAVTGRFAEASDFDEVSMEAVSVPVGSPLAGKTLGELSLARTHGVQVAGIDRGGRRLLNPGPDERLEVRDELLLLGTPAQIGDFKVWLKE